MTTEESDRGDKEESHCEAKNWAQADAEKFWVQELGRENDAEKTILQRICPHWWTEKQNANDVQIRYDVTRREKCVLCGKRRVYARVPEPHPAMDKEALVEALNSYPGREFIVDEWVPHSMPPPTGRDAP